MSTCDIGLSSFGGAAAEASEFAVVEFATVAAVAIGAAVDIAGARFALAAASLAVGSAVVATTMFSLNSGPIAAPLAIAVIAAVLPPRRRGVARTWSHGHG